MLCRCYGLPLIRVGLGLYGTLRWIGSRHGSRCLWLRLLLRLAYSERLAHLHTEGVDIDSIAWLLRRTINPLTALEVKADGNHLSNLSLCDLSYRFLTHKFQHEHILMRIVTNASISIASGYIKIDIALDVSLTTIGRTHLVWVADPSDYACYLIKCHIILD